MDRVFEQEINANAASHHVKVPHPSYHRKKKFTVPFPLERRQGELWLLQYCNTYCIDDADV